MTTSRINQVTIVPADHLTRQRALGSPPEGRPEMITQEGRRDIRLQLGARKGLCTVKRTPELSNCPTEFPKERSAADKALRR